MAPPPYDGRVAGPAVRPPVALPTPAVRVAAPAEPSSPGRGGAWDPAALKEVPTTSGGAVPDRLTDRHGRTVRDLRLSVTDRCNLRCTYCMPAAGLEWLPAPSLLTTAEIARLARIAVERLGVERIRLTGGEPLLRRELRQRKPQEPRRAS